MQGYQHKKNSMKGEIEDTYELLQHSDSASYHTYEPTAFEARMSLIGDAVGSICCCFAYQSVKRGEVGLITQFGRYIESKDEGLHYVNMITQEMVRVDTKRTTHALTKQTVVTADNLQVSLTHSPLLSSSCCDFDLHDSKIVRIKSWWTG
jgi:hypothetical protein